MLIEVKLRPTGPWRAGHRAGDRERVDVIYHSDALYSAITHAMRVLGWLDEWLEATAGSELAPAVRFSSLFPFLGKTRLITPPRSAWPDAPVRLVPLELARGVTQGAAYDRTRWQADIPSECLLPQGSHAPFEIALRSAAAVDRLTGAVEPHRIACLEFASNAGWWGVFDANQEWEPRVKSAFRLLADSGFGGERSRGWGRASDPTFSTATALFPERTPNGSWWLLSLFSPHATDQIDWTKGDYALTVRGGWTDSPQGSGPKRQLRMVEEGSVLSAEELTGRTIDVAPEGFPHPVYRNGQALSVPLPSPAPATVPEPATPPVPSPEPEELEAQAASAEVPEQPEPNPEPEGHAAQAESAEVAEQPEPNLESEGHAAQAASAGATEQLEQVEAEPESEGHAAIAASAEVADQPEQIEADPEPEPNPAIVASPGTPDQPEPNAPTTASPDEPEAPPAQPEAPATEDPQ